MRAFSFVKNWLLIAQHCNAMIHPPRRLVSQSRLGIQIFYCFKLGETRSSDMEPLRQKELDELEKKRASRRLQLTARFPDYAPGFLSTAWRKVLFCCRFQTFFSCTYRISNIQNHVSRNAIKTHNICQEFGTTKRSLPKLLLRLQCQRL